MARSLNKAALIGNLTRDPELRYTPQGSAVCTFGLATNRQWTTDSGEKKEDAEFHRIVSWNKLAELCSQLLSKGRKVYVEGRLQTRNWTTQEGQPRTTTEIVISEMIILDSRRDFAQEKEDVDVSPSDIEAMEDFKEGEEEKEKKKGSGEKETKPKKTKKKAGKEKSAKTKKTKKKSSKKENEDIPF